MRIRDYGIVIGKLPTGKLNKISDVPGVTVGHSTIISEKHQTGVSVVMPCPENPFIYKLPCASFVWNGFGKTAGLVQIDELGTLETPIALTNTLNVGKVHDAMVGYMIDRCAKDGKKLASVNPVVCETNDSSLNNIRERAVEEKHVLEAIADAKEDFEEGAVGCGRGTSCHGMKAGVGSASRLVEIDGKTYTVGVFMQTNHGKLTDFMINGDRIGERINIEQTKNLPDQGSCIIILATDLPVSDRQLKRIIKRCSVGLARLGSFVGHGSGEVFIGFSTANKRDPAVNTYIYPTVGMSDDCLDIVFRAAAEATEEAELNSLVAAERVSGNGRTRHPLSEYLGKV